MKSIDKFVKTIARLRAKGGCPWDRKQTHKTLKRYLIEESYEVIDAIDKNNPKLLMEELGDVLLQIVLHSQIASEKKEFTFSDLVNYVNKKMISRHPHVFGNIVVKNVDEVMVNWENFKRREKSGRKEIFDGVPKSLPALMKAYKVSKKASKAGFDWEKEKDLWKTFENEFKEFKEAARQRNKTKQTEELGDLLFMIVNLARWYKLDPEGTLNSSIKKFIKRFNKVKKFISSSKKELSKISSKELDKVWKKVKREEK